MSQHRVVDGEMSSEVDSDDDSNYTPEDHSDSEADDQEEDGKSDNGSDDSGSEEISTQASPSSGRGQRGCPRGRRGVGGQGSSNSSSKRKENKNLSLGHSLQHFLQNLPNNRLVMAHNNLPLMTSIEIGILLIILISMLTTICIH